LRGRGFCALPLLDQRTDVALEHLSEIVVAIEFILINDTGKARNGLGN
jgi:hypothetical protein